jgi:hypothetical protein
VEDRITNPLARQTSETRRTECSLKNNKLISLLFMKKMLPSNSSDSLINASTSAP